jgi:arylsulfatase A-like enzyme
MFRRNHMIHLCLTAALLLPELFGCTSTAVAHPRSLLLITLDTMRADRLPAYGFTGVLTPALDRIAAEGAIFEEAYAAVPLTLPSHVSLFTGLYPPRHGVRDNAGAPLSGEFTTLAEVLRERRMTTAAFVASSVLAPGRGLEQGFDLYSAGDPARCSGAPPARRRAGAVVDEATSWLERHDTEPFFAWIHLYDTHRPYDLPAEYKDRYLDPYLAAIAYEDAQIARVISHLETRGLLTSTLIVVAGDHGESLGDHGEKSHGIFLYQEALRVPFMVRGPGVSPRRVTAVARLVDVMPTVLDLFGVSTSGLDGVTLAQAGTRSSTDPRLEVYSESMYPRRFGWAPLRSLRADRYKVIDAPRAELYDLISDPGEERNVLAEHPTVAAAMLHRLRSFESGQEPPATPGAEVDNAVLDRIASLGYVGSIAAQAPAPPGEQTDPKDRIAVFNKITSLQWENTERRRSLCR